MDANYKIARCLECRHLYAMDEQRPISEHKKPFRCEQKDCDGLAYVHDHLYEFEVIPGPNDLIFYSDGTTPTYLDPIHLNPLQMQRLYKAGSWGWTARFKAWIKKLFE